MKNALLFTFIMLIALGGGAGLFYQASNLPDNELISREVNTQLLKIENLISSTNELALRNRANLDSNYDLLVRSTSGLERLISDLSSGYFSAEMIGGSLLERRFLEFSDAMEVKAEQIENFKSHNSVRRNSEKYAPLVGAELVEVARQNQLVEISDLYNQAIIDVLEFTKQESTKTASQVTEHAKSILETESLMPVESRVKVLEFANHLRTAVDAKQKTDLYLNRALNFNGNNQVENIYSAWSSFQAQHNHAQQFITYYTTAYVVLVIGLISLLAYRLRRLYKDLDNQVEEKTEQVKVAYNELHNSERQRVQSEKMASLGQLVAGVAHEVNTPLSYVSSNIDTVKNKIGRLLPVINSAKEISIVAANPNRDPQAIQSLLSKQLRALKTAGDKSSPEVINTLFEDATEGLGRIRDIISSLTSFSHIENTPNQDIDINVHLEQALKECSPILGNREITKDYAPSSPVVLGATSQLLQVFTNVITNACHATDSSKGKLIVVTNTDDQQVQILISDNGTGMDQETLKRAIEPFFTTKEVGQGTGLGLSIAHQIISAHDGTMQIESTVGEGTQICITLPIKETFEIDSL